MKKLIFAAICTLGLSTGSFAGVIYNWVELTPSIGGQSFSGSIEFSDWVWHQGYVQTVFGIEGLEDSCNTVSCPILNEFGVLGFTYSTTGPIADITSTPFPIRESFTVHATLGNTLTDYISPGFNRAYIGDGGFFAGWGLTTLSGDVWYIQWGGIDLSPSCGPDSPGGLCAGATGRWVLDRSTLPVPEPSSLLLMAIGSIALSTTAIARRRKTTVQKERAL